ncbi:MAG: transposase [Methylophilaceae bacterium]|nr:transposase [Methyloradius sp.]
MKIGSQLHAPHGYLHLKKDLVYHFLKSHATKKLVFLVLFGYEKGKTPSSELIVIDRDAFEAGIPEQITLTENQTSMPLWLKELEGRDISRIDLKRPKAVKQHRERVEERLFWITPAIITMDEILDSPDPQASINAKARECATPQNESRFRAWLLTYLCFGRDQWVLLPPFHKIGHWDRAEHVGVKFGRPSLAYGKYYGFGMTVEMRKGIIDGYRRFGKTGVKMSQIYSKTLISEFNCKVTTQTSVFDSLSKVKAVSQPQGLAFPTIEQFKYEVKKAFSIEQLQKNLYGEVRFRTDLSVSKGKFSEAVANLYERVEFDGYYTIERPKSYTEGNYYPPLCVVRCRDTLSGMLLGIGFSTNKESSEAYRTTLFSMAVPKKFFCSLFGIEIEDKDWPCVGMTGDTIFDRGPGSKKDLIDDDDLKPAIKGLPPAWFGQSKAGIESSHPRDFKIEGRPTYTLSNLTPVELAKREIFATIAYNQKADMSDRIYPNPDLAYIQPTPIGLWNHYDQRGRNDAMNVTIEKAIRSFLSPIELKTKHDGFWFKNIRYDSSEIRSLGILEDIGRGAELNVLGYGHSMCLRFIWVDINGRLFQLAAKLPLRGLEDDLFQSLAEVEEFAAIRSYVNSEFTQHQHAVDAEARIQFHRATGHDWNAGTTSFRKPKKVLDSTSPSKSTNRKKAA